MLNVWEQFETEKLDETIEAGAQSDPIENSSLKMNYEKKLQRHLAN